MTDNSFTPIQSVSVPSTGCLLCPSMDLIALSGNDRLLIQRTVSWQRVAVTDKEALCWSPDGGMLVLAGSDGYALYNLELGMLAQEDEACVHQQALPGVKVLVWAHVGLPHAGWILTNEEKERELEWRYRSAYLDRSSLFLPPSSYHQGDGDEDVKKSPTPACKTPLSLLCAATTDNEINLLIHGRYPIAKLACSTPHQIVCSSDLQYLSVLHTTLTIYSIPALVTHRYSLQTIAALNSSIQSHLHAIREGVPAVSNSWRNALRPLDAKFDALQKVLKNYGIESSISSVLLQHIILGKSSDHANALDQFFTGVQMNDQLLVRMEKTLHNALAGVESVARSSLLAPARSLQFDVNELCGLDEKVLPDTRQATLQTRVLLYAVECFISQLVDARFRLRDLVSWMRSAASAVKAMGTPPDSVQHDNAKKRRVPQALVHRVSDYFKGEMVEGQSTSENVIGSSVSAHLSGKTSRVEHPSGRSLSPASVKTSLFDPKGVPSISAALDSAKESIGIAFAQPREIIQRGLSKKDVLLPFDGINGCVIHPRMGLETFAVDDETKLDGCFCPRTSSPDDTFSCSRQWTVVALPRHFNEEQACIHLFLIPLTHTFVLSRCLALPKGMIIKEIAFYGDDGKSTLFGGKESLHGKEGRQSLGLLLQNELEQQLWLLNYDSIQFEITSTNFDLRGLDACLDSAVTVTRGSVDEDTNEDVDNNIIYAKARSIELVDGEIIESKLLLCGSRGVGGVVSCKPNQTCMLYLFDLEDDDEVDDDDDEEMDE